ncbi:helix-turn-helix domain-containing protein [Aureimonas mangrovi]|uniref:helix-turn-helix domain-containing protein n=1 Tax=Aureimonas mangrovi TaxID=2758041 RepID=UPI00163D91EC|nr:helix-turn-helix domain-containing protein [Aureimonas mangrovi]
MDDAAIIDALERQVCALRDRVEELEAILAPEFDVPAEWCLTRRERQVLSVLVARPRATREAVATIVYGLAREEEVENPAVVIESHVSKLRRKLKPYGIAIISRRFDGYWLEDRKAVRDLLGVAA